jgi:TolA-binding protein
MPSSIKKTEEVEQKKRKQTDTKKISIKSKKETDNVEELAQRTYDENVKRLAELAVNRTTSKNNTSKNSSVNNPFAKTQEKLKGIINESDRFIDTTYYMLKMENDSTEIMSNVVLAGGNTTEYFEKLIRTFDNDVNKYDNMTMFDCGNFSIYANQFGFNDSLRQKAIYHYADCCSNHDLLEESAQVLEELLKEKMNKNIAPSVLSKLGQIYCLMDKKSKADKIFKRLKKEFPKVTFSDCSKL